MGFLDKLPMLLQVAVVAGAFVGAMVLGGVIAALAKMRNNGPGGRNGYVTRTDLMTAIADRVTRSEIADHVTTAQLLQAAIDAAAERALERQGVYARIESASAALKLDVGAVNNNVSEFARSIDMRLARIEDELDNRLRLLEIEQAKLAGAQAERKQADEQRARDELHRRR